MRPRACVFQECRRDSLAPISKSLRKFVVSNGIHIRYGYWPVSPRAQQPYERSINCGVAFSLTACQWQGRAREGQRETCDTVETLKGKKMGKTSKGITKKLKPKVFISYSWTTQHHQELVKGWADRLLLDGVEVIIDIYSLQDGQDTYSFMEKIVTEPDVTNVLIFCDSDYAEKADARKRGVGVESQIISKEVYDKVEQTKFIPIVCEFREDRTACLPAFLKSRRWIDFSSSEKVNENWERLVRNLYGKPLYEKPKLGEPPAYLEASATPPSPANYKYELLRQSLLEAKPSLSVYRREFLDACVNYADELRVRERPDVENLGQKVLEDFRKLIPVRDHIVDWVLLESETAPSESFCESLFELLEKLVELRARPQEVNQWNDAWFEAHRLFAYELFLYVIASLLKARAYEVLGRLFSRSFLLPPTERQRHIQFMNFDGFWVHSETLKAVLSSEGRIYLRPAAELVKREANREDLPFPDLIQADLLILLMSCIKSGTKWYPQLMLYAEYEADFPLFVRASRHEDFIGLVTITGISNADDIRSEVTEGFKRLRVDTWGDFESFFGNNFWMRMNMDRLNTIR